MRDFLAEVTKHKREELEQKKAKRPLPSFQNEINPGSGAFLKALADEQLKIIAEVKPRSPSLGNLEGAVDPKDRLSVYEKNADAVSVLCDQRYFAGSVELLAEISANISRPTLLKDFVLDPYQVYEARHAGAEAVLLIVKMLDKASLQSLSALIIELGMTPLVEVQTEDELALAKCVQPQLLLINNRNLDTLEMDLSTVERLVKVLDYPSRVVAASGIECADQMLAMRPYASRFLIGSALMASGDPVEKFKEFRAVENRYEQIRKDKQKEEPSCPQ